jgi:hypothetical protein
MRRSPPALVLRASLALSHLRLQALAQHAKLVRSRARLVPHRALLAPLDLMQQALVRCYALRALLVRLPTLGRRYALLASLEHLQPRPAHPSARHAIPGLSLARQGPRLAAHVLQGRSQHQQRRSAQVAQPELMRRHLDQVCVARAQQELSARPGRRHARSVPLGHRRQYPG